MRPRWHMTRVRTMGLAAMQCCTVLDLAWRCCKAEQVLLAAAQLAVPLPCPPGCRGGCQEGCAGGSA